MKVKPVLGDWEIPHIVRIASAEQRRFAEFAVPGRVGSLYQDLSSAPTRVTIEGSLYGDEARDEFLQTLRGKFLAGEPVTFVADIVTATQLQYVVVETLRFQERAQTVDQLDYYIELRESPPPPPPPDPLGGLDAGLLGDAAGFLDTITGALDAIQSLGDIPELKDPTPPLNGIIGGVESALTGLSGLNGPLKDLFGDG